MEERLNQAQKSNVLDELEGKEEKGFQELLDDIVIITD